jgi:hypothetical protein
MGQESSFRYIIKKIQKIYMNYYIYCLIKVRVRNTLRPKKTACPARVAVAGLENIETVHEPEPIQAMITLCMDKVAVL